MSTIGPHAVRLLERIMDDKLHPEMGYRGCLGIIRLAQKYSAERVGMAVSRRHAAARQHPGIGVLRIGLRTCSQTR